MTDSPSIPGRLYVGTSGWAYSRWRPEFYPAGLAQRRFLEFYSSRLNAVEVNYTFCGRHVLGEAAAGRWLAQTPREFLFAFRGPKPITHFYRHRLRNAEELLERFKTTLLPFQRANRLGPALFQLPETFPADAGALENFLRLWPREWRVSFEFRHPSWFTESVYEILRRRGAALCLAEREEAATPEILTAGFVYLRLRKHTYSPSALREIAKRIRGYRRARDVFAFFRQTGDKGPLYASEVARALRAETRS